MRSFHQQTQNFRSFSKASLESKCFQSPKILVNEHLVYIRFHLGDIALDDIVVSDSCPKDDRLCTFEDTNICNYANDVGTQYNWVRTTGDDPFMNNNKPTTDHTDSTGNGAYMIIDVTQSSASATNQRARLISQTIVPNGEQCIEFWYYADAKVISTSSKLNLFVRPYTAASNSSDYLLWSKPILQVSYSSFSAIPIIL